MRVAVYSPQSTPNDDQVEEHVRWIALVLDRITVAPITPGSRKNVFDPGRLTWHSTACLGRAVNPNALSGTGS